MIMLTATIWVMLVTQEPSAHSPQPREFKYAKTFASQADCEAAGKKWVNEVAQEATRPVPHEMPWWMLDIKSYRCAEQDQ
jgi:hypothetical protein